MSTETKTSETTGTKYATGKHGDKTSKAVKTANMDKAALMDSLPQAKARIAEIDKADIAEQNKMHPKMVATIVASPVQPVQPMAIVEQPVQPVVTVQPAQTYKYIDAKAGVTVDVDSKRLFKVYGQNAERPVVEFWQGTGISKQDQVWLACIHLLAVRQLVENKGFLVSEIASHLNTYTLAVWSVYGSTVTKQVLGYSHGYYVPHGIKIANGGEVKGIDKSVVMRSFGKIKNVSAYRDLVIMPWLTKATNGTIDTDKALEACNATLGIKA